MATRTINLDGLATCTKNFYVGGENIEMTCPSCGNKDDIGSHVALYDPIVGELDSISFGCDDCDKVFDVEATLRMSLELGNFSGRGFNEVVEFNDPLAAMMVATGVLETLIPDNKHA